MKINSVEVTHTEKGFCNYSAVAQATGYCNKFMLSSEGKRTDELYYRLNQTKSLRLKTRWNLFKNSSDGKNHI